jgi:hypothetical protein
MAVNKMLTREQLHAECRKIFDALPDRGETIDGVDDAVLKLNKQAAMAIKLQSKLDMVREWVDFWEPDIRDISHVGHDTILSILND